MDRLLLIDDEEGLLETLSILLRREGYAVTACTSGEEGLRALGEAPVDLLVTDIKMPGMDGIGLLRHVRQEHPEIPVILMTAQVMLEDAIQACNEGAFHYLTKPFANDDLLLVVRKALEYRRLKEENLHLRTTLRDLTPPRDLIGRSPAFGRVLDLARTVGASESIVLVQGESGTGKELLARYLHQMSHRADGPFVTINCGALPESLLESELFGHIRGSFTGAVRNKEGLFAVARGGTFFMDEVGETSLAIQVKLLRVIQEKEFVPVGATAPVRVDVRIVAATNKDLEREVALRNFRSDLYYRLNVIPLQIPPLRERREDIPLLLEHFLARAAKIAGGRPKRLSPEAMRCILAYRWPGNVRELENVIERAVVLQPGEVIAREDLPDRLLRAPAPVLVTEGEARTPTLEAVERSYIKFILDEVGGNKARAAEILGIDPSTLYRKIARYRLS